jgi:hypothetical protein
MTVVAGISLEFCRNLKKPKLDVLDQALWIWFYREGQKGISVSSLIIKEKALYFNYRNVWIKQAVYCS